MSWSAGLTSTVSTVCGSSSPSLGTTHWLYCSVSIKECFPRHHEFKDKKCVWYVVTDIGCSMVFNVFNMCCHIIQLNVVTFITWIHDTITKEIKFMTFVSCTISIRKKLHRCYWAGFLQIEIFQWSTLWKYGEKNKFCIRTIQASKAMKSFRIFVVINQIIFFFNCVEK